MRELVHLVDVACCFPAAWWRVGQVSPLLTQHPLAQSGPHPPPLCIPDPFHRSTASGRASRSSRSGRRWWRLPSWCCPP